MSFDVNNWIRNEIGYMPKRDDFGEICQYANHFINKSDVDIDRAYKILKEDYGAPLDPKIVIMGGNNENKKI